MKEQSQVYEPIVQLDQKPLSHKQEKILFDRQWQEEKIQRRHHNMNLADKIIYHGTYYIDGQGHGD